MRAPLIVLIFAASLQAVAQNAPASSVFDTKTLVTPHPQPTVSFEPAKETKPRIFDRKFFVLAGVATAATVFDVATTSHCMSTYADCGQLHKWPFKLRFFNRHKAAKLLRSSSCCKARIRATHSTWKENGCPSPSAPR
jgi:hypothetical protein